MGFSRQEYWSRLPSPSPGELPNPGIEPWSPALQADSLPSEPPGTQYCPGTHSILIRLNLICLVRKLPIPLLILTFYRFFLSSPGLLQSNQGEINI